VISSVPVVAVLMVDGSETVLIATKRGRVNRVAVSTIPVRRRRVQSGDRVAKGAAVFNLDEGDRVATAELASDTPAAVAQCLPTGLGAVEWPWGTSGQNPGERIVESAVLLPRRPLESIAPGGRMTVARDEWAKTEIHRAGSYSCAHCGQRYEHPEDVYACIDGHVARVAPRPVADDLIASRAVYASARAAYERAARERDWDAVMELVKPAVVAAARASVLDDERVPA